MQTHQTTHTEKHGNAHYKQLVWMTLISFAAMYILMYSMVDRLANVIPNINQFYMAGLMTMPMIVIEILVMRAMYRNKRLNKIVIAASVLLSAGFYFGIREQAAVNDRQFLKSMIPHHAAALLMVEKTEFNDPEIQKLGRQIIESQQAEIEWMKAKLKELENK